MGVALPVFEILLLSFPLKFYSAFPAPPFEWVVVVVGVAVMAASSKRSRSSSSSGSSGERTGSFGGGRQTTLTELFSTSSSLSPSTTYQAKRPNLSHSRSNEAKESEETIILSEEEGMAFISQTVHKKFSKTLPNI